MSGVTAKNVARAKHVAEQRRAEASRARAWYIEVMRLAVRDGVSQSELAKQLGVSRQYIGQLLRS